MQIEDILENNANFVEEISACDPLYFSQLASHQQPHTLWITCADSRVSPEILTGCRLDDLIVLRIPACDCGSNSAILHYTLAYALQCLSVRQIVVCGHSHCDTVRAAIRPGFPDSADLLLHLRQLYRDNSTLFEVLATEDAQCELLCQLHTRCQVDHLQSLVTAVLGTQPTAGVSPQVKIIPLYLHLETGLLERLDI